jgi:conjugative relaxase-like TrwC/TraI family protein
VLSVSKLGAGQEGYYLDAVAHGVEDYYLGNGEAPGRWVGSASELLDLDGQVDAAALRAVLEGRGPADGVRLIQGRKDRVPGFDLTFSAPKSVSVMYGLGDPDIVGEVRVAHDRAVDAALGWLEREGCVSRRGIDGVDIVETDGFVAAAFVHRSSRAGDPQLHTHVLVANLTHCTDGQWRTLHGGPLLWQARTAGYLYKAQLRHELTVGLGVEWGAIHKGAADIVDIPPELCALFSTRRQEIQDELDARGLHTPQAARVAALETRQAKEYDVDIGAQRDQWHARAAEAGHDPEIVTVALHRTTAQAIGVALEEDGVSALLGAHGLTEQSTTFDRRAVLRGWCEQLPAGATIAIIEQLAAATLADPRVVPLNSRGPFGVHSTAELLALERRLVDAAAASTDRGIGAVDEHHLRAALDARPELSREQVAAIAAITMSGNGVDVIVAAAGTGKTFCLDAAHDAWQRAGYHVIGAAWRPRPRGNSKPRPRSPRTRSRCGPCSSPTALSNSTRAPSS